MNHLLAPLVLVLSLTVGVARPAWFDWLFPRPTPWADQQLARPEIYGPVLTWSAGEVIGPEPRMEMPAAPLIETVPRAISVPEASAPVAVEVAAPPTSFKIPVPFRTQLDGAVFQEANCGPAALAMVLQAFGMVQNNADLRWRSHTHQGTLHEDTGTALQFLARVGRDFGLNPIGLYEGKRFHQWSVSEIREQVAAGRPVIPLAHYRLLPGHETSMYDWDHYIVIYGVDGDRFLYHDPVYPTEGEQMSRWITAEQLAWAMKLTVEPYQAVAFDGRAHTTLRLSPL